MIDAGGGVGKEASKQGKSSSPSSAIGRIRDAIGLVKNRCLSESE